MLHFNNIHSSRLNWSIKSMLDNIFLKGSPEQEIENSSISMFQKQNDNSDSEGVESDLEKSEISEVEEDQPVESTYLQNLIAKRKGYIEKISDLVEKHAKKGVSFDFIEAYFNTKLESDHFKNSLNSYIEAAFLHERSERQKRMMHGQVCKTTNTEKKM